jgi:hypothetical protein
MATEDILAERQKTHGDFATHAHIAQALKDAAFIRGKDTLSFTQREALEMILHKIARIVNGDPNHKDHWDDIAGYATLAARELNKNA